jgi:two-component system chemotaxis sensor kinase CheA
MVSLDDAERDPALVNRVFRGLHTIKGGSGLVGLPPLTDALHTMETLLDLVREDRLPISAELVDLLLEGVEIVTGWFETLSAEGALGADADLASKALVARLEHFLPRSGAPAEAAPRDETAETPAGPPPSWLHDVPEEVASAALAAPDSGAQLWAVTYCPPVDCFNSGDDPLASVLGAPGYVWSKTWPVEPLANLDHLDPFDCKLEFALLARATRAQLLDHFEFVADQIVLFEVKPGSRSAPGGAAGNPGNAKTGAYQSSGAEPSRVGPDAKADSANGAATTGAPDPRRGAKDAAEASKVRSLRVAPERVDALMTLVGELVVAKNGLAALAKALEGGEPAGSLSKRLREQHALIDRLSSNLQTAVMQIRMMPLRHVFQRFPPLVRQLSHRTSKDVHLEVVGDETEADKSVVEDLGEPLVHLVRNALDHGIEPPEVRRAAGKPDTAQLRIAAYQEGDEVRIEVSDDGRGIDAEAVRQKAVQRGLFSREEAERLSRGECLRLIFAPGLSTASSVTEISGRGVGMDAVSAMVQSAGGTVDVWSEEGRGTKVTLRLPSSVAITQVMVVSAAGILFGIPMKAVLQTARLDDLRQHRVVASVGAKEDETTSSRGSRMRTIVGFRDQLVPMDRLDERLGLDATDLESTRTDARYVVFVKSQERVVAVAVSRILEPMEVLSKPLEGILARCKAYSGTAVLGDGQILLVLDPLEVFA